MRSQCTYVRQQTPLTNATNRNRDPGLRAETHMCVRDIDPETHLCATTNVRTSQKHRLRRRGLSPLLLPHTGGCVHVQPEQATGSVTTDSLRLQHACVCVRTRQ